MAHVGDVDLQREVTVVEFVDQHRVVEIAGRFAVDGDDGQVAEIAAAPSPAGDDIGNRLRLLQHVGRESGGADDVCG